MNPDKKIKMWAEAIEPILDYPKGFKEFESRPTQGVYYTISPDYLFERIYKELELITGLPCKDTMKDVSNSGGYGLRKMDLIENLENIIKILGKYRKELTVLDEELPPKIGDKK